MAQQEVKHNETCAECIKADKESEKAHRQKQMEMDKIREKYKQLCAKSTVKLYVKGLTGKTIQINVHPKVSIIGLKLKIEDSDFIPPELQRLFFNRQELEDSPTLIDYNIQHQSILHLVINLRGGGISVALYEQHKKVIMFPVKYQRTIEIPSFHVSCRSDKFTGEDMAGVVLYSYD
eukprot:96787_1